MAESESKPKSETKTNGKSNDSQEMPKAQYKHFQSLRRHISLVIDAAQILGERLIEEGDIDLGRILVANSFLHDNSKFYGIEWRDLQRDEEVEKVKNAVLQHTETNHHHPEFWGDMNNMPSVFLAEMVCDWWARSSEMGTDLRLWIKGSALSKYDISPQGKAYKQIKRFVDLLLDKPFGKL